jgi:Zn-dependent peptidase ImmA (M78 family)
MKKIRNPEEVKSEILKFMTITKLGSAPHLDMMTLIVKTKEYLPSFNYLRVPDHEMSDAEGMYDPDTKLLTIPERVFCAMNNDNPRARFTITHEVSHALLGHTEIRFRHTELKAYEKAKPNIRREESEANRAAALILAPDDVVSTCASVEDVMDKCGLSRKAAEIRKSEFDAEQRRKRGEQRPLPFRVAEFLRDAKKKGYKP